MPRKKKEEKTTAAKCREDIEKLLKKYDCSLVPFMTVTQTGNVGRVNVQENPKEEVKSKKK